MLEAPMPVVSERAPFVEQLVVGVPAAEESDVEAPVLDERLDDESLECVREPARPAVAVSPQTGRRRKA